MNTLIPVMKTVIILFNTITNTNVLKTSMQMYYWNLILGFAVVCEFEFWCMFSIIQIYLFHFFDKISECYQCHESWYMYDNDLNFLQWFLQWFSTFFNIQISIIEPTKQNLVSWIMCCLSFIGGEFCSEKRCFMLFLIWKTKNL